MSSVPIISPSPVDINSTIHISCHSVTQINTQIGNHHHCNNGYITVMIKVINSTTPKISQKHLQNIGKKLSNKTYVTFNI